MKVAYLLYPGFTALDVIGAFQVLVAAPGVQSAFVACEIGFVPDSTGCYPARATHGLHDLREADVLVVPGSDGAGVPDVRLVEWLQAVHPTTSWTIAAGTGSLYLAAAGVLAGATAATHWSAADTLSAHGVTYSSQRLVRAGKVITSAGASAGIDLALVVLGLSHGPAVAQTVQLMLEYDPAPPYDAGSPATAPPEIGELVRAHYGKQSTVSTQHAPKFGSRPPHSGTTEGQRHVRNTFN